MNAYGDITTHANKAGLEYAWKSIHELGSALKCDVIAAATGNHDVDSRIKPESSNPIRDLEYSSDLSENLKQLDPPYPVTINHGKGASKAHERRVHYFGADYILLDDHQDYRLIIFNSCARHTGASKEYERGRIAESTMNWIKDSLDQVYDAKDKKISIFLCHHHPIVHEDMGLGTYDFIANGSELMNLLSNYGHWVVIHGHKHHSKLSYSASGNKRIPVFSAGTLSSHKDSLGAGFNNQFFILDLEMAKHGILGTIKAWSWKGNIWSLSRSRNDGVFTGIGFGMNIDLNDLAEKIAQELPLLASMEWNEIVSKIPDLNYLSPKDYDHLNEELKLLEIDMTYNQDKELESLTKNKVVK